MTFQPQPAPLIRYTDLPRFAPSGKAPSDEILAEIVSRVREVVEPEKIILFGSGGREEMHPESDIDLMVVVDAKRKRNHLSGKIHCNLHADDKDYLGFGFDVIAATPEKMDEIGPFPATVHGIALTEGRVIYERQG